MRPFNYIAAKTRQEALTAIQERDEAKYLGGGTNLVDLMKEDVERPEHLIEVADLDNDRIIANLNIAFDNSIGSNTNIFSKLSTRCNDR